MWYFLCLDNYVDDKGKIKTLESFINVIKDKSNWLCDYKTIISMLKYVVRKYNFC